MSGCWLWTAGATKAGYGLFRFQDAARYAHRVTFEALRGAIPDGLELDHLCRVTFCCNPDHLEAVTHKVNLLRGTGPAAQLARATHCKRGHPLSGENLVLRSRHKYRACLACERMRDTKSNAARLTRSELEGKNKP